MAAQKIVHATILLLLIMTGVVTVAAQTPDPGLAGPHAVIKGEYNLGDLAYTPPAGVFPFPLEVRGSVHYPADLTSGPFPVLVWLHGRHSTCYDSVTLATSNGWPCTGTEKPILSYAGYDYAAKNMASHGYIVISVSSNAINAADGAAAPMFQRGMPARAYLLQKHLDLWNDWNTTGTGPFGTLFNGRLDMQNIGTMGHSRGGEGVIYHAELNRSMGSPYGIKAVLTLAPVNFYRHVLNRIPLMNIAPYCDGDVINLPGVHYYDDARYRDTGDETPKHSLLIMGANHNYFNTVWTPGSYPAGGVDDWDYTGVSTDPHCGVDAASNGRLDTTQQKAVYTTYAAAFYRYYLGHETAFAPILNTADVRPPASALVDSSQLFMSYHPGNTDRVDINRTDTVYNLVTNDLGGPVNTAALTSPTICSGGLAMALCNTGLSSDQRPHRGTSTIKGVGQMRLKWTDTSTAVYENAIPASSQDITGTEAILFRVCENFVDMPAASPLTFSIQLVDAAGNISNQVVTDHTNALFYPPGIEWGVLPKVLFNTVRIPVAAFTGIDLAHARYIRFRFNRSAAGAILVSDLAFKGKACGRLVTAFTDTVSPSYEATFTNISATNPGDSLIWHWQFGDAASGTGDTSSLTEPTHTFPGTGSYTVCLSATAYRKNGLVCTDTFCRTVTVVDTTVFASEYGTSAKQEIIITPNPAKDHLHITGAGKGDMLRLMNLYGETVFTTAMTHSDVYLPQQMTNGIYYAEVNTARGRVIKKIVLLR